MYNHDDKYPARPGFEPGTSRLQASVDTNEPPVPPSDEGNPRSKVNVTITSDESPTVTGYHQKLNPPSDCVIQDFLRINVFAPLSSFYNRQQNVLVA